MQVRRRSTGARALRLAGGAGRMGNGTTGVTASRRGVMSGGDVGHVRRQACVRTRAPSLDIVEPAREREAPQASRGSFRRRCCRLLRPGAYRRRGPHRQSLGRA